MGDQQQQLTKVQWDTISAELQAPFDPEEVDFRPQSTSKDSKKGQAICYVDRDVIAARLDAVVGAGNWSFDFVPLVMDKGVVQLAKGTLTIYGVSKSDVGEASSFSPSKGCISDTLKRAGDLWGIARYLRDVPSPWVPINEWKQIPPEEIAKLRARLPKPGQAQAAQRQRPAPQPPARVQSATTPPAQEATRPAARADSAPVAASNVTEMDAARASELAQRDLANKIRAADMNTLEKVETFLVEHLGDDRVGDYIDPLKLKDGASDITVGEVRKLIAELFTLNQRRAEAETAGTGAAAAESGVPQGAL